MKKVLLMLLIGVCSGSVHAVDLGSLDTSFSEDGVTDGYDVSGEPNLDKYGADVVVDSQGRLYVVGTVEMVENSQTVIKARLERWLNTGQRDVTFGNDGVVVLDLTPASRSQFEYELAVDSSDGVFIGYSTEFCPTGLACESDVRIYHYNVNGSVVGNIGIPFDLTNDSNRLNDDFADMVFVPEINKLAVAVTVDRSGSNDTDYGIAVLDYNSVSGALAIDETFSTDGKSQCWFDHADANGSEDRAAAIVYHKANQTFVVGGSTFEGNGLNADGWNMAFCEFDFSGSLVRSWSTQNSSFTLDSREYVSDVIYMFDDSIGGIGASLMVAGTINGGGDLDFSVTRYQQGVFNDWEIDTSFGSSGSGITTVGFQYPFVGETSDSAAEIHVEEDGGFMVAGNARWSDNVQLTRGAVVMTKITASGTLDTNWGIGKTGRAVHTFNTANRYDQAKGMAYDPVTEELYIAGWSYDGAVYKSLLSNFHNDMIFGGNFEF